jgi:hypothetical protein
MKHMTPEQAIKRALGTGRMLVVRYDPATGDYLICRHCKKPANMAPHIIRYIESRLPSWQIIDVWAAPTCCQVRIVARRL